MTLYIARPDGYRIRRILSAVINFIRFREDQSPKFDHLANECEATADKVSEVQAENSATMQKSMPSKRIGNGFRK